MEKILPQNMNAEQCVLGSLMIDNKKIYEVIENLKEEDFYRTSHRKIYNTMIELSNDNIPIDLVTLSNKLKEKKELDNIGGAVYLNTLLNVVPTAENIKSYIDIVRETSLRRKMILSAQEIINLGYADTEIKEMVLKSQEIMLNSYGSQNDGEEKRFYCMSELMHDTFTYIENIYRIPGGSGLKTGFIELDNILGGLQNKELYVLAGDTNQGKTALALNIAYNIASQNIPVAFFSIEMGKENLLQRLLCSRAKVDYTRMRNGFLGDKEWANLTTIASEMMQMPLYFNDFSTPTVLEIMAMAKKMMLYKGIKLIVIDFLQQIHHDDRDSETKQVTGDVRMIKGLAKTLNIPVILLSSLSRRKNYKEPPTLSLLRQSGAIESVADAVIFVYRPEAYYSEPEHQGIADIIIAKQRNGATGTIKLAFIKHYTRFENLYQREGQ